MQRIGRCLQVKDWPMFWSIFQNWVWAFSALVRFHRDKKRGLHNEDGIIHNFVKPLVWLQLEPKIIAGNLTKVT
jgi:hypothetical protein